jgi:hypothetical protein
MAYVEIVAAIPADRLPSVIVAWLWEFHDPPNWPTGKEVWALIEALQQRPDAAGEAVQRAIADCHEYLRSP